MDQEDTDSKTCGICRERPAVTECDGCLRPLCKKCRSIEIWRTPKEEVTVRCFCAQCRDNPQVNPHGRGAKVFGLGEVTDLVNQKQERASRFKIKLKMS